jgi:hypothetical protein
MPHSKATKYKRFNVGEYMRRTASLEKNKKVLKTSAKLRQLDKM